MTKSILKHVLTLLLCFSFLPGFGQLYQNPLGSCARINRWDTISLVKKTSRIVLISFQDKVKLPQPAFTTKGNGKSIYINIWDWKSNTLLVALDSSIIKEKKEFTGKEMRPLLKIFYNHSPIRKSKRIEEAFCYIPHHGIIFYDATDKPIAYFEICTLCSKAYGSTGFYFGEFCQEKISVFVAYFKKIGFQYELNDT